MSPFVALHVEQGVPVIDEVGSLGTEGHVLPLAVTGDEEAVGCRHRPWQARRTLRTVGTRRTRVPTLTYDQRKGVNYKLTQIKVVLRFLFCFGVGVK